MGCLFAVFAGLFPRAADIILWIARPQLFLAPFGGAWFWPLLGIIFLPFRHWAGRLRLVLVGTGRLPGYFALGRQRLRQ
jgi:hypothetical protein